MTVELISNSKKRLADFITGDETALPMVYCCFAGRDKALIRLAASALADRMEHLVPSQIVSLLYRMGEYTSLDWYAVWAKVSLPRLRRWLKQSSYFAVLAAGSAHPNGYFREACLKELCNLGGAALPYLLLRANDWVRPIRMRSLIGAEEILKKCPPKDVLTALPYLHRLERCHRRSEADYARLMELTKARLTAAPELLTPRRVQALDRDGRRLCYRIALSNGLYTDEQWVALLGKEKDPFTRRVAARAMLGSAEWESRASLLLAHPDSSLRLLALEAAWVHLGTDWDGYGRFLCDSRRTIREWARFAIGRQRDNADFAVYYREHLGSPECIGAVAGLGETGGAEDGALVKPFLESENSKLRKAALTALGRLCGGSESETYYHSLFLGGGCAKIAFHLLRDGGMRLGCERIFNDMLLAEDRLVKRRLCALLGRGRAWDSLPWLLRLWDAPDEGVARQARYALDGWSFGYQHPLPGELERCRTALEEQRYILPKRLTHRIEFELAHA